MQVNLTNAETVRDNAASQVTGAQSAFDAAEATAAAEFLTSYPNPSDLVAGTSTVDGAPIAIGTLSLDVGDTWAAADINALQSEMDSFVDGFS